MPVLGACAPGLPDSRGLTGTVVVDGSSTLTPLVRAAADELVERVEPGVAVDLTTSGTATGVARLCAGAVDVAMVSRPMTEEESVACDSGGVEPVEVPVGRDVLTVVVPSRTTKVQCLRLDELRQVFAGPGSGAATWADVRPGLPATALVPFAPGAASGTADVFVARVLDGQPWRDGVATSEDDAVIVQGVAESPGGVGIVPATYAREADDLVRAVAVDAGDGCVAPSDAHAADGSYALTRDLSLLVSADAYADDPVVAALVDLLVRRAGALAREVGGVPPGEDQLQDARAVVDGLGEVSTG